MSRPGALGRALLGRPPLRRGGIWPRGRGGGHRQRHLKVNDVPLRSEKRKGHAVKACPDCPQSPEVRALKPVFF